MFRICIFEVVRLWVALDQVEQLHFVQRVYVVGIRCIICFPLVRPLSLVINAMSALKLQLQGQMLVAPDVVWL